MTYLQRIRECLPDLTVSSVHVNHDGLVNDVLIVNDEWVFRFPKNDHWAKTLQCIAMMRYDAQPGAAADNLPEYHYEYHYRCDSPGAV